MIKLSIPHLSGREKEYVDRAVDSTWIVPLGPMVDDFEGRLNDFLGDGCVVALSSGTAAIHLALILAGVKKDDEVICQSLTFAASANPITYIGARPVFVDSESLTWNISPCLLRRAIVERYAATGRYPAAIVAVDLYGMPADYTAILEIAGEFSIPVIEDAAEAIGSEYRGTRCGLFGSYGTLSFNGNKMITTSGGGALICHNPGDASRALFLATQARENRPYYYHETIGYNYRLSNISAAIGCAQSEVLESRIAARREIHRLYSTLLADCPGLSVHSNPSSKFNSNFWLTTILLDDSARVDCETLRQKLLEADIESRRIWRPMHMQPVFAGCPVFADGTSEHIFNHGLCLPSSSTLTDEEICTVAETIKEILE